MKVNPQPNFEVSLKLKHPLTGLWLTDGVAFKQWLETPNAKLWLSGIPGAGKTVLAETIIEKALKHSSSSTTVMFFFCDYKNPWSQDPVHILRVLVSQLARQNDEVFELLRSCYEELHPSNQLGRVLMFSFLDGLLHKVSKH